MGDVCYAYIVSRRQMNVEYRLLQVGLIIGSRYLDCQQFKCSITNRSVLTKLERPIPNEISPASYQPIRLTLIPSGRNRRPIMHDAFSALVSAYRSRYMITISAEVCSLYTLNKPFLDLRRRFCWFVYIRCRAGCINIMK